MYNQKKQRRLIMSGLCAILLIMVVGYAAFASQLKINGTSSITSNWKVLITDITSKNIVGSASNAIEPTHTDTTATFKTSLEKPGDSITYDITVTNNGTLDAVLKNIEINTTNSEVILFESSGLKQGDVLITNTNDILTIKVTYNPNITSQPENTTSNIEVTLNYEQNSGNIPTPGGDTPTIGGNEVEIVDSGDGLYADEYEDGRYIYRGSNPNNYITFNNETWRIIAKEADGSYKLLRDEVLPDRNFDSPGYRDKNSNGVGGTYCAQGIYRCNAWAANSNLVGSPAEFVNRSYKGTVLKDSEMLTYLNNDYYNSITINKENMISHIHNVGVPNWSDSDLNSTIEDEKKYQWMGNVGLISLSDWIRANSNMTECGSDDLQYDNNSTCRRTNWMYNNDGWWTLSPYSDNVETVRNVNSLGFVDRSSIVSIGVRPVIYLNSSINLIGDGTKDNPYIIAN